jgi:dATP pyrophosphohydrolase
MSTEPTAKPYKLPLSVLVVVYSADLQVLMLERADRPGFWQSVTGSCCVIEEPLLETAVREVAEETGLDARRYRLTDWGRKNEYEIYPHWRHRYAPGITHNTEHVFGLELNEPISVTLSLREHLAYAWLPWQTAADRAFSWSNSEAIRELPQRAATSPRADGGTSDQGPGRIPS